MTNWTNFSGDLENGVFIRVASLQQMINNTANVYERIVTLETAKGGGVPIGALMIWYGGTATIPTGFHLADGTNGTPDLRGYFAMGIASTEGNDNLLETGGETTHDHAMGTISAATKHKHTIYMGESYQTVGSVSTGAEYVAWGWHNHDWDAETSSEDKHDHSGTYTEAEHLPPYTKYYWIARIPA